jgi:transcriptional regulator with XRE-family HTH domain
MGTDDPTATFHALGLRLRLLRRQAGLSGPQLAARLGWSQSKVSRIETDRHAAPADVKAWLDATTDDPAVHTEVAALAERALAAAAGIRTPHRGTLHDPHATDLRHATRIRHVAPWIIQAPFRPPHYTSTHLDPAEGHPIEPSLSERLLELPLSDTEGTPPDYHLLLAETALHWIGIHSPADGPRQAWARLHAATRHPTSPSRSFPPPRPAPTNHCARSRSSTGPLPHQRLTAVMDTPVAAVTFTGHHDLAVFETLWTQDPRHRTRPPPRPPQTNPPAHRRPASQTQYHRAHDHAIGRRP